MMALTVQQPWAWAIVYGGKDVENRTTAWKYRGPLAIHAGRCWSERGTFSPLVVEASRRAGYGDWAAYDSAGTLRPSVALALPEGAIIGIVDLVGVHLADPGGCCDSPWAETEYVEHGGKTRRSVTHLELRNPRSIQPLPCKGALGLWTVPPHLIGELA